MILNGMKISVNVIQSAKIDGTLIIEGVDNILTLNESAITIWEIIEQQGLSETDLTTDIILIKLLEIYDGENLDSSSVRKDIESFINNMFEAGVFEKTFTGD